MLPQPPSTSTLPQLAAGGGGGGKVREIVGSINGGSGAANPFSVARQQNRAAFTKSSDDLLKSYGLDFSKLSTASDSSGGGAAAAAANSLQNVGEDDLFADLDPLAKKKSSASAAESAEPTAPPRARRQQQQQQHQQQQKWTTFE